MKIRVLSGMLFLLAMVFAGNGLAATAAAKPPAKKADAAPAQIEGVVIPRGSGFLGLNITGNHFVLTFYDADKKKIAPDAMRATLRWPVTYQKAPERAMLEPGGDGFSLSASKFVRPPHNYKLFLTVFSGANEETVENYTVDYQD